MKATIVFESLFGNTRAIAEAVATGLRPAYDVTILEVTKATPASLAGADLVLLGAPTHAHGLSRPGSRAQSGGNGSAPPGIGIREFLEALPQGAGTCAAAFDTRARGPRWLVGSASRSVGSALKARGYKLVAPPMSFTVVGMKGPLVEGEVVRAQRWGRDLHAQVSARTTLAA